MSMDTFLAIEKILHFHHTTSRQPLRVSQVCTLALNNGTPVTQSDIDIIKTIYPEAYRIFTSRGQLVMDALDLPHNAETRKTTFYTKWLDKENIIAKSLNLSCGKNPADNDKFNGNKPLCSVEHRVTKKSSKRVLMGRLAPTPKNTKLSLVERIRLKEAALKNHNNTPDAHAGHDRFIQGQLPKMKRILDDLAAQRNGLSLEMSQIMDILRTNLFKLGDSEISKALHLLVETYPDFCSIVTVGETTHVKVSPSVVA